MPNLDNTQLSAYSIDDWTTEDTSLVIVGLLVLVGAIAILFHRFRAQKSQPGPDDTSITRPVLALVLVGTLVVLAAASFSIDDDQTRNLLIGGVVSLSSGAVAFYFASSGATEARRDLLKATAGILVPDLTGKTFQDAQAIVSQTSLQLTPPAAPVDPQAIVATQEPAAGGQAMAGTSITVTLTAAETETEQT